MIISPVFAFQARRAADTVPVPGVLLDGKHQMQRLLEGEALPVKTLACPFTECSM